MNQNATNNTAKSILLVMMAFMTMSLTARTAFAGTAKKTEESRNGSADERAETRIYGGLTLYLLGSGKEIGYQLAPDSSIELRRDGGTAQFFGCGCSNQTGERTSLAWRQFSGNSFNVSFGTYVWHDHEVETIHQGTTPAETETHQNNKTDSDYFGISFAFGNRWQFGHLTVGMDWFEVGRHWTTSFLKSRDEDPGAGFIIQPLKFNLGVAF